MAEGSPTGFFKRGVVVAFGAVALAATTGGALGTSALEAQGPPDDLEARHQRLLPLFETNGVAFTDADETKGRLVVGVRNRGIERSIRARLAALGVDSQSVDIVETDAIIPLTTLRDLVRPVDGGLQIRFTQYLCTLGFNAKRGDVIGFVTAAHCSTNQGAIDGTQYYQPLNQVPDEFIGMEIADPAFFKNGNKCPRGKRCRYSDANFSRGAAGTDFKLGEIARTTGENNGALTIDTANPAFAITAKGSNSLVAKESAIDKVGRTTGWTRGLLTNTCVNTGVSGTNIVLLCQNFVSASTVIVAGGDSGSNVFTVNDPPEYNQVTLRGTLWGGNSAGTMFVYSPIERVEQELGSLTICGIGNC